jgi:hypothetical protein
LELAGAECVGRHSQPEVPGRESADGVSARAGLFRAKFWDFGARAGTQQPQDEERFFAQHFGTAPESIPESQAFTSVAGTTNPAIAKASSKRLAVLRIENMSGPRMPEFFLYFSKLSITPNFALASRQAQA